MKTEFINTKKQEKFNFQTKKQHLVESAISMIKKYEQASPPLPKRIQTKSTLIFREHNVENLWRTYLKPSLTKSQ